jgi:hypothetical protein
MARYYSGKNQPLAHWNNLPIYLTTILAVLMVVGLFVSAVLMSMSSPLLGWLVFAMPLDPAWSLWRLFTYVFIGRVSFFTPFGILFFYWMSVGIETHMGRPKLAKLLVLIALVTPAVSAVWWWLFREGSNTFINGDYMLLSGLLVAFATLYPNSEAWGWIPFKWVAFACIVCGSLMLLASPARPDWLGIAELWGSCLAGFGYIRYAVDQEYDDYESPFSRLTTWWKRRKFRVVGAPRPATPRRSTLGEENLADEVDSLLDKIAKSGIDSLTAKERARLEKAREALMKRERH